MANLTYLTLDDPVDASLSVINGNFAALNDEIASLAGAAHTHSASDIVSGVLAVQRLGTGLPSASTFLRGDGQWQPVAWGDVSGKPSSFPPATHGHSGEDITSGIVPAARLGGGSASSGTFLRGDQTWQAVSWADITGKPSVFTPAAHTHAAGDITAGVMAPARLGTGTPDENSFLRGDGTWQLVLWANVAGKPSTFTPSAHTHAPSDLTQAGASTGQALVWNGSQWAPGSVAGGNSATPYTAQGSNFTAAANTRYRLTANSITVTLPASPADGDWVELVGSVTGCTVARNGKTIMGLAEDLSLDVSHVALRLAYVAAAGDWRVTA